MPCKNSRLRQSFQRNPSNKASSSAQKPQKSAILTDRPGQAKSRNFSPASPAWDAAPGIERPLFTLEPGDLARRFWREPTRTTNRTTNTLQTIDIKCWFYGSSNVTSNNARAYIRSYARASIPKPGGTAPISRKSAQDQRLSGSRSGSERFHREPGKTALKSGPTIPGIPNGPGFGLQFACLSARLRVSACAPRRAARVAASALVL